MTPGSGLQISDIPGILGAVVVCLTLVAGLYWTHRDRDRLRAALSARGVRVGDALPSVLAAGLGLHILGACMGWLSPLANVGLWSVPLQWAFGVWFVVAGALAWPHTVARSHDLHGG